MKTSPIKTLKNTFFILALSAFSFACAPIQTSTEIAAEAPSNDQEVLIPTQETELDIIYRPIVHRPDW